MQEEKDRIALIVEDINKQNKVQDKISVQKMTMYIEDLNNIK